MKVSYNWLKQYLDLNMPAKDLAEKIERTAVEVDSVTIAEDGLKKLVVGHILSMKKHPESDHLHICSVDVGEDEPLQIVCGAPNVDAGQKVIVALPNSRIGGNVKIKRSKMRGVESEGMICALDEIGFSKDVVPKEWADGIYVFDDDVPVGEPIYHYLGMDDPIIDLDVTPNRGDMLSIIGTVHDLAAIYDQKPEIKKPSVEEDQSLDANAEIKATADSGLAKAYKLRVVEGVKIAPSPTWLQITLWNAGIRPINNVVDVTNYILLKYGQPLHSFDKDKIDGDIVVRNAKKGEKLVTLDEDEHELSPDDMVIADNDQPIALAGVMGGFNTQIDDDTQNVVIESAIFDSFHIRKTAQRHVLHSEASQRFERGINPDGVEDALNEAVSMIKQLAGGKIAQGIVTASEYHPELPVISITAERANHVLGTSLKLEEIKRIFDRLEFPSVEHGDTLAVTVPARRWDIHIDADLFEEVARIYGYDNLPVTLPTGRQTIGVLTSTQRLQRASRQILEGIGLTQAISYSLTTDAKAKMFLMRDSEPTKLLWPMTQDHTTLRMNLVSGLLDDVAYNHAHKVDDVSLYETGRVFYKDSADQIRPEEVEHVAGVITGNLTDPAWNNHVKPADFYLMKGMVNQFIVNLGIKGEIAYSATDQYPEMHPGRTANISIHGHNVGFVGQIHPQIAKMFKIKETYAFELNMQALIDLPKNDDQYQPIAKYPSVKRDISMIVDSETTNDEIVAVMNKRGGAYLSAIRLFDVYEGENVPDGKKSMAYSLTYVNPRETLKDEVVNAAFEKIKKRLTADLNAEIR
ncbi:phenylalanine--tRNA ligase subunit beta [Lentilactobacillus sp. IMAU92037]|uniref:phenylalanine--tRNA ligase subunit beta n=1 Tax=Lentilactobacillus dabitei TaxID=2831523 RepID=UPI001C2BD727|nr:phenylalanine--tRNA ligase subunit beta [Lentilactobacillus dabitei]MBV0931142.1 phenylalanine--tRNA ligase subunit beta [Lentilactobacillus dabitei]